MSKPYSLYDDRTNKPLNKDGKPMIFEFLESPMNGDEIEVLNKKYTVQRVWKSDGELIVKLRGTGL